MKYRSSVATIVAVAVFLSASVPAHASIIPGTDIPFLAQMLIELKNLHDKMEKIRGYINETRETLNDVYPESVMDEIQQIFYGVRSIASEVNSLSCGWKFNAPVRRFWDGVFNGGPKVCKPSWQALFGLPVEGAVDSDLQEMFDSMGTLSMSVVGTRIHETEKQHKFWTDLYYDTKRAKTGRFAQGVGLAERHMAIGIAGLGNLMVQQGEVQAVELQALQARWSNTLRKERLETDYALQIYGHLADMGGATVEGGN
jgi:hypothetical protein